MQTALVALMNLFLPCLKVGTAVTEEEGQAQEQPGLLGLAWAPQEGQAPHGSCPRPLPYIMAHYTTARSRWYF